MPEGIAAVVEDAGDVFPDERAPAGGGLGGGLVDGIGKLHIARERATRGHPARDGYRQR
jgi:hypothetical protein